MHLRATRKLCSNGARRDGGRDERCAKYLNDKWKALRTACTLELEVLATCTLVRKDKAHVLVVVTAHSGSSGS